jgi:hypothetical protein
LELKMIVSVSNAKTDRHTPILQVTCSL